MYDVRLPRCAGRVVRETMPLAESCDILLLHILGA